jgi:mannose-6-phosphate isomerase-like protein (cupin superfamily)
MDRNEVEREFTIRVIRENDRLWLLEGSKGREMQVGLLVSTEHLTVGQIELVRGQQSDVIHNSGDTSYYVTSGQLRILCPAMRQGQSSFELGPLDGFYLPAKTPHQLHNAGEAPVTAMFGVAPRFKSDALSPEVR